MLKPDELVNAFVCGLPEATRVHTLQKMYQLSLRDRSSIIMVRKISILDGKAQRPLLGLQKAGDNSTSSRIVTKAKPPHPRQIPALLLDALSGGVSPDRAHHRR